MMQNNNSKKRKKKKQKATRVSVELSLADYEFLTICARGKKTSRSIMARRILHQSLRTMSLSRVDKIPDNQLNLFDAPQISIFE